MVFNIEVDDLREDLRSLSSVKRAKVLSGFFKTGKGQYAEGDLFLGVSVAKSRVVAKKYNNLKFSAIKILLKSKIHEERLLALLILVDQFSQGDKKQKEKICNFYLGQTKYVNNWDLVDLTADKIVGAYLLNKPKSILYKLAKSDNLWERRIAIVATYNFIKNNNFNETLKIAEILLPDKHDLIQKAVGWMMREVGKRDQTMLEDFLKKNYQKLSRITLRYAIEKFPSELRKTYLSRTPLFCFG